MDIDDMTEDPSAKTSPIISFYKGGTDFKGRTLNDIIEFSDSQLEYQHDFIQVLFPIPEPSLVNRSTALLDDTTVEQFRVDHKLRAEMRKALARMLRFLGFDFEIFNAEENNDTSETLGNIRPNPKTFPRAARNWMRSHNEMRITRMLRCLRCCGMGFEAQSFYAALKTLHVNNIGNVRSDTLKYWTRASTRDIRIPPSWSDAQAAAFLEARE